MNSHSSDDGAQNVIDPFDFSDKSPLSMHRDCTDIVHKMHNLLLYLLSTPDEFTAALKYYKNKSGTSSLSAFHAEYDRSTDIGSSFHVDDDNIPIPFIVFAPDAEVVLPQAHTASQLFGCERDSGIELEAASGIVDLSHLFLRWLALMPNGDHCNVIDPPGITVMKISGGRYRVTAAHRVVWTWNNSFMFDPISKPSRDEIQFEDLVTMTIIDVFETDTDGKLLSYCPTFDNRQVRKTDQTIEKIKKSSYMLKNQINVLVKSPTALKVNEAASLLGRLSMKAAMSVKETVQRKIEDKSHTADNLCISPTSKGQSATIESNISKPVEFFEFPEGYSYVGQSSTDLHRR